MRLRVELYHQSKQWRRLAMAGESLADLAPEEEQGWISWAYALRELERVADAQDVLWRAEPAHGKTSAVLHYNLACYACLLGDLKEAKRRLAMAVKMDDEFESSAWDDPDLAALRSDGEAGNDVKES
ncbi:TPR end-of-group domain-containing protein [Synoicihabitans lomoniglobus]|nr:hypothetical protein [Opitutaceae bacterium LMO-M01]